MSKQNNRNRPGNRVPNIPKPLATQDLRRDMPINPEEMGIKARAYVPDTAADPRATKLEAAPSWIPRKLPIPGTIPADAPIPQPTEAELAALQAQTADPEDDDDEAEELLALARGTGDAGIDIPTQKRARNPVTDSTTLNLEKDDAPDPKDRAAAQTLPDAPTRHPLLSRLLASFGLERLPVRYNNIGGFKFGFRKHNTEDLLLATRIAGTRARGSAEFDLAHSIVLAAICITSINDESVYDIFGITLTDAERQTIMRNPTNPPQAIVESTASHIILFMTEHIEPEILDDLSRSYRELYHEDTADHVGDIVTYQRTHYRFECNVQGCEEVQNRIPEIIDAVNGTYKPVFCPIHGEPMQAVSTLEKYRNNPLV